MSTASSIRSVARRVRRYLDRVAIEDGFSEDLNGLCGKAAAILYHALEHAGFNPKIAHTLGHAFVLCEGYIVDVTATQFGQPDQYADTVVRSKLSADMSGFKCP